MDAQIWKNFNNKLFPTFHRLNKSSSSSSSYFSSFSISSSSSSFSFSITTTFSSSSSYSFSSSSSFSSFFFFFFYLFFFFFYFFFFFLFFFFYFFFFFFLIFYFFFLFFSGKEELCKKWIDHCLFINSSAPFGLLLMNNWTDCNNTVYLDLFYQQIRFFWFILEAYFPVDQLYLSPSCSIWISPIKSNRRSDWTLLNIICCYLLIPILFYRGRRKFCKIILNHINSLLQDRTRLVFLITNYF